MKFLTLIPASSQDLPRVMELDQECFGGLWTLDGYQRELDSPNSELLILTRSLSPESLEASPVIGVGCLWAILEEAHITLLGIDPQYRRQGLGQLLLYGLLVKAQQRKLEWATLEVRASNQAAIALYQKFGFREAGRRRQYYPDQEDALILWRGGLHHPEFRQTLAVWQQSMSQHLQQQGWQWSEEPIVFAEG